MHTKEGLYAGHPWKCPQCGAGVNECGKGSCASGATLPNVCAGTFCSCDCDGDYGHGERLHDPCFAAFCAHCNWHGTLPHVDTATWPEWAQVAWKEQWTPQRGWRP